MKCLVRMFITSIVLIIFLELYAVDLVLPCSAMQNAASGLIFLAKSPGGTHYNPAYIYPGLETGFTNLFNLQEIPFYSLHSSYLYKKTGVYLGGNHLSHHLYKETMINLTVNYHFENISTGAALRLNNILISDYQNDNKLVADMGAVWKHNQVTSGFSLKNVTSTRIGSNNLPIVFLTELNYRLVEDGSISVGLEKEQGYLFNYKIGVSYQLYDTLLLVTSYSYEPSRIGMGFAIDVHNITISYGMLTHQYLSPTHYVSVSYDIFKNNEKAVGNVLQSHR